MTGAGGTPAGTAGGTAGNVAAGTAGNVTTATGHADLGAVLAALADPTRRVLLDALAEYGQASATSLADRLPVSRQAVVKHLQVLDGAGLVEGRRAGREVLYLVRPEPLAASAKWLASLAAVWDRRLAAVKRRAEAQPVGQGSSRMSGQRRARR